MGILPEQCAVYGSGTFADQTVMTLTELGVDVVAVVDAFPGRIGHVMPSCQMTVEEPSDALSNLSVPVILGVSNFSTDIHASAAFLRNLGVSQVISPVALYLMLGWNETPQPDHYWMSSVPPAQIAETRGEGQLVEEMAESFSDAESSALFQSQIRWRSTGELRDCVRPKLDEVPYSPSGIEIPKHRIRFLDLGAYTGDTILDLIELGLDFEHIWAFEPDSVNFLKLVGSLKSVNTPSVALPLATGSTISQKRFSHGGSAAAKFNDDSAGFVQSVALDDVFTDIHPNFVKMDIEGAELETLNGMRKLITDSRPTMAISVYHKPHDLWVIPNFVRSLNLGYSLFLRQHGHQGYDTVLYAIPSN